MRTALDPKFLLRICSVETRKISVSPSYGSVLNGEGRNKMSLTECNKQVNNSCTSLKATIDQKHAFKRLSQIQQ